MSDQPCHSGAAARVCAACAEPDDMVERHEFNGMPEAAETEAWKTWLRRHGIDPNDVIVAPGGFVERRLSRYQVCYLGWRGAPVVQSVQLEGPPLPFPPGGSRRVPK